MISNVVTGAQAFTLALQGLIRALILICFSLLSVTIGGVYIGFALLPVTAIYLWPFRAHYAWSMWAVLFAGLVQDMVSGGPLGMWAIINCILFLILDPASNQSKLGFLGHWGAFFLFLMTGLVLAFILARISLGQWPIFGSILLQGFIAFTAFPIVYGFDRFFSHLLIQSDVRER